MARSLPTGSKLVLASHNHGKLREITKMLAPYRVDAVLAADFGLPEPDETAPDFVGNARLKAVAAAVATGLPALSDDSGFSVAALDGAPGVFSARWAGLDKNFAAAMARVQRELGDKLDRRAWFTCALCLAWPDGHTETFLARSEGCVVWPPRGDQGFGYDPMFLPAGASQTYGEMDAGAKNASSHRARAFAQLLPACFNK